ncbi:MAG: ATP-binding cassette domain-containing protein [bacterium]
MIDETFDEVRVGNKLLFHKVSLQVPRGQVLALMGRSGIRKTTVLRLLVDRISGRRPLGYMPQHGGLFPWQRVQQQMSNTRHGLSDSAVHKMMTGLSLEQALLRRFPVELSGGQRLRVGVGRALLVGGEICVLDEPFSGLDPATMFECASFLLEWVIAKQITLVFSTHGLDDAVTVADRILVLQAGDQGNGEIFENRIQRADRLAKSAADEQHVPLRHLILKAMGRSNPLQV